jgi:acyl carrier protein
MRQPLQIAFLFFVACNYTTNPPKAPAADDAEQKLVRTVIADQLKVDPASIVMDRPISEPPLKADELDLVEIVMTLEEQRGVEISDAALERYGNLGDSLRITPNQLASVVREARSDGQRKRRK